MAHSLSAKKRIRQNAKHRLRNRADKSALKTQVKKFLTTAKQADSPEAVEKEFRQTQKNIDQLAAKRVLHKNTAARRKSQLARQLNSTKAKPKAKSI